MDSHLVINERCHGEQVKDAAAVAPGVAVPVFVLTLVIEAVHLRDLPRLVVPSQQGYPWDTENSNQSIIQLFEIWNRRYESSVAEPEPVKPKYFEDLEPEPKLSFQQK